MADVHTVVVIEGGKHLVCITTDGLDRQPVPHLAFDKPRDAIRAAERLETQLRKERR